MESKPFWFFHFKSIIVELIVYGVNVYLNIVSYCAEKGTIIDIHKSMCTGVRCGGSGRRMEDVTNEAY